MGRPKMVETGPKVPPPAPKTPSASYGIPFNQLSPAKVERLGLLLEELGEAQQAIGKILRHGYASTPTNREMLEREFGDVLSPIIMLCREDVSWTEIQKWSDAKTEKVKKYLHHQEI